MPPLPRMRSIRNRSPTIEPTSSMGRSTVARCWQSAVHLAAMSRDRTTLSWYGSGPSQALWPDPGGPMQPHEHEAEAVGSEGGERSDRPERTGVTERTGGRDEARDDAPDGARREAREQGRREGRAIGRADGLRAAVLAFARA